MLRHGLGKSPRVILNEVFGVSLNKEVEYNVEILAKYSGYFERQARDARKLTDKKHHKLPDQIDYQNITGLRNEAKMRLAEIKPQSLAQASLVQGITPADLSLILIHAQALRSGR